MKKKHKATQKNKRNKKVFLLTILVIFSLIIVLRLITKQAYSDKISVSEKVASTFIGQKPLAGKGTIDDNTLNKIKNTDYEQMKSSLNIKEDFCLYVEDSNGSIIASKGSSKLSEINCRG